MSSFAVANAQMGSAVPPVARPLKGEANIGDAIATAGSAVSTAATVGGLAAEGTNLIVKSPVTRSYMGQTSNALGGIGVAFDTLNTAGQAGSAAIRGDTPAVIGHMGQMTAVGAACVRGGTPVKCIANMATTGSLIGHAKEGISDRIDKEFQDSNEMDLEAIQQ